MRLLWGLNELMQIKCLDWRQALVSACSFVGYYYYYYEFGASSVWSITQAGSHHP